jgi:hypothetical protein
VGCGVADQPCVPAGQAGKGTGKSQRLFVADQPSVPARQAGRGREESEVACRRQAGNGAGLERRTDRAFELRELLLVLGSRFRLFLAKVQ